MYLYITIHINSNNIGLSCNEPSQVVSFKSL